MKTTPTSTRVPRLLSIRQVAERSGFCETTTRRWIQRGDLLADRFGRSIRVVEEDAVRFFATHRG